MRNTHQRLEELLLKHSGNIPAERALKALRSEKGNLERSTGPLPTHYVRRIYERRARINERQQSDIEGFPELIKSLDLTTEPSVEINAVTMGVDVFVIFTDPQLSTLLGILITKSREVLLDPKDPE